MSIKQVGHVVAGWVVMSGRKLAAGGLLFFWALTSSAVAGTYQVTVEPTGIVTVDVLEKDKAPTTAELKSVGNASHGKVAITPDMRSVSFRAVGDYVGSDSFTYLGKDKATNQEYTGTVEVTVTSPQRIVNLDYVRVSGVLGILLVLAIVVEIGLTTVFSWKYFEDYLAGKGWKTPITVAVSCFFTFYYKLDTVADLLSAFTTASEAFPKSTPGKLITAFLVAGGSGTVNRVRAALFDAFGQPPPRNERAPESQQAQLVVYLTRSASLSPAAPVRVSIDGQLLSTETGNRLPAQAAYQLSPGAHTIKLDAVDSTGKAVTVQQPVNVAPSANVSLPITL